jgi:hypothetical protein
MGSNDILVCTSDIHSEKIPMRTSRKKAHLEVETISEITERRARRRSTMIGYPPPPQVRDIDILEGLKPREWFAMSMTPCMEFISY